MLLIVREIAALRPSPSPKPRLTPRSVLSMAVAGLDAANACQESGSASDTFGFRTRAVRQDPLVKTTSCGADVVQEPRSLSVPLEKSWSGAWG
jgi:hypothetical protein